MAITGEINLPKLTGVEISPGITCLEEPKVVDGTLRCLANVHGCLVVIQLKITLLEKQVEVKERV